jgi:hypothetical protein
LTKEEQVSSDVLAELREELGSLTMPELSEV